MIIKDLVNDAARQARVMIETALAGAVAAGALPEAEPPAFAVEIPGDAAHGDFASNVALAGAKTYRCAPAKIAAAVLGALEFDGTWFARAEVAGPGFLNLFLRPEWFAAAGGSILALGAAYGRTEYGGGKKVMVEFVSANPTGPMHMGNARGGAIGDALAGALDAAGFEAHREFYVNDAGNQIEKFAASLAARYLQIFLGEEAVPFAEDLYQGEDIRDRAREFADIHGDSYVGAPRDSLKEAVAAYALPANLRAMKEDLERYRIRYDVWFHESSLYEAGLVDKIVEILRGRGLAYERDGALWYKASEFGAEKDEVLIRANGNATYFAADIAYHYDKFAGRGFDTVVNIWGADHHGHVARLKGAMDAVGLDGGRLDIVLMQLVRLMKDGEPYRMSKRSGRSVTLRDLLDDVPADAARFYFNMQSPGSSMDFDLDLAVEQSSQNPVYYAQYAHARICSILRKLAGDGVTPRDITPGEWLLLRAPEETQLLRRLAQLPGDIVTVAQRYDPSILTHYCTDLANLFHRFYANCRVWQEADEPLMQARLALCLCVRTAMANTLGLLGIAAPESM